MKILYGVQGTGNGHISRARMMAKHFTKLGVEVDYLFSGRAADKYFDMEPFGDYQVKKGLTFHSKNGEVSYLRTALVNNLWRFFRDVASLELQAYELVISDFEPVTAWAAKLSRKPVLGIGHQYAFGKQTPVAGANPIARIVMRLFAPANPVIGLHWKRYQPDILPPIVDTSLKRSLRQGDKPEIVVYLPFENQASVIQFVSGFDDFRFLVYSPELKNEDVGSIGLRKTCVGGFRRDLQSASGVISNSGFELISECLHLGLPVLTKPLHSQMEQQSNAKSLRIEGHATVMETLHRSTLRRWLDSLEVKPPRYYPDIAEAIAKWIYEGRRSSIEALSLALWRQPVQPTVENENLVPGCVSS
ncbi:MAG: MJ1255/VC2487 family glycosyltransferase [Pseudomonadales bacterium]